MTLPGIDTSLRQHIRTPPCLPRRRVRPIIEFRRTTLRPSAASVHTPTPCILSTAESFQVFGTRPRSMNCRPWRLLPLLIIGSRDRLGAAASARVHCLFLRSCICRVPAQRGKTCPSHGLILEVSHRSDILVVALLLGINHRYHVFKKLAPGDQLHQSSHRWARDLRLRDPLSTRTCVYLPVCLSACLPVCLSSTMCRLQLSVWQVAWVC